MDKRIRFCILLFLVLVAVKELFSESNRCVGSKCAKTGGRTFRSWKRATKLGRTRRREDIAELEARLEAFFRRFYESGTFTVCVELLENPWAGNEEEGSLVYFRVQNNVILTPETLFSSDRHALALDYYDEKACTSVTTENFPRRPIRRLRWKNVGEDGINPKNWYICKNGDASYKYHCYWQCESILAGECTKKTSSGEYEQITNHCTQVSGDVCRG